MATSDRPLLAGSRTASENEAEREATEEDALLTNPWRSAQDSRRPGWWHWFVLGWAFFATLAVLVLAVLYQHAQSASPKPSNDLEPYKPSGKRNLIFMVTDGMGPASLSLTRSYRQHVEGLPIDDILTLDEHLIGSSRTRSSSSLVTDSAAGATAFSCGKKSYNGAISVLPSGDPCGTVLEAAKRAGYMTGLVVTTRITDATPATFASHVHVREEEDSIARQLIGETHPLGHVVDLMLGGGRCFFLPNSTSSSCRADDIDVTATAQDNGYTYISTREEFDALEAGNAANLPLLGLFADHDIPFEIDRRTANETYPSLDEMARTALNALSIATQNSDKGFFLLIEGSRIDHAGHENDPAAQVHEVLAYDKTFTSVLEYLDKSNIEGVAVSTSDHETGGLSVARRTYFFLASLLFPLSLLLLPSYPHSSRLYQEPTNSLHSQSSTETTPTISGTPLSSPKPNTPPPSPRTTCNLSPSQSIQPTSPPSSPPP